jgi:hypothetical protein
MRIQSLFLVVGVRDRREFAVKRYKIVAEIFADNYSEAEYFDEKSEESGDSIVSGMQLEIENI